MVLLYEAHMLTEHATGSVKLIKLIPKDEDILEN